MPQGLIAGYNTPSVDGSPCFGVSTQKYFLPLHIQKGKRGCQMTGGFIKLSFKALKAYAVLFFL